MKKHIIDPDRLAKTFSIQYKHYVLDDCETGEIIEENKNVFIFELNEPEREKSVELTFDHDSPDEVRLNIETKNNYNSKISLSGITNVVYIPQYHAVRLESHTKTHFSILKIYWRGQFDFDVNWDEKFYKDSVWSQREDY